MISEELKQANKMQYLTLLTKLNIDLTDLTKFLEEVDYFNKPATAKYFKAYPGGLCQHALDVYYELSNLCHAYCNDKYTDEDIIKVSLFKDLYKALLYEQYNRNVKNEVTGKWEQVAEYRNSEIRPFYGDLGFSSFMVTKKFISFTDEQIEAICNYQLISDNGNKNPDTFNVLKEYPLVLMLHMADLVASYLEA